MKKVFRKVILHW